jgi:hypothetical protein
VDLVEELPPPSPQDPELDLNSRPDLTPNRFFLAWFLPMCVYILCVFGLIVRPRILQNFYFGVFFVCLHVVNVFGSFWMLYQAVRYEKRVVRYAFLVFVPFLFVWYSLVRVPLRKEFQGKSEFIR